MEAPYPDLIANLISTLANRNNNLCPSKAPYPWNVDPEMLNNGHIDSSPPVVMWLLHILPVSSAFLCESHELTMRTLPFHFLTSLFWWVWNDTTLELYSMIRVKAKLASCCAFSFLPNCRLSFDQFPGILVRRQEKTLWWRRAKAVLKKCEL